MKLADAKPGTVVYADEGFDCLAAGKHTVETDAEGPFIKCGHGKHYLSGQQNDGGELIGVQSLSEPLEQCIEKFWADNPDLKKRVLQDFYCHGRVSAPSNRLGADAVDRWLTASLPNGESNNG